MKRFYSIVFILYLAIAGMASAKEFRFAFLTDIHISSNPSSVADLEWAIEQVNQTQGIEFVIIGGDITEEGDGASLRLAKERLDRLKVPFYAVPGNHETKWSESGVTAFADVFGSERFRFEFDKFLFLGFNSGPLMRMADGHVAPQDIAWLKAELAKESTTRPIIIVTHYPLKDGDVDNWYEVTDAIRTHNIRAVLGGHYHSNRTYIYDGIPGILNRSTLRAKDSKGGYNLYEVTTDSIRVYEHRIGEEPAQWTSLPLKTSLFDKTGSPDKYPDYSVNEQYPQVDKKWLVECGAGIYSSPAIENNRLFVGDDTGRLTAYDLTSGEQLWSFESGRRIVGTPAAAEGIVVFGSADKSIYGIAGQSGEKRWQIEAKAPVLGAVTIANGIAFIGASDRTFRAIDIHSGKVKWSYEGVKGYIETKPLITGNLVIFGAWDNTLYALDKDNGQEVWKWTGGLTRMHFSPAAVWPVAAEGKVFITDPQRAMTAIDLRSGKTVWRTFQSMVRETIGLSEDKKRVYSKTMNDSIVCFATKGNEPLQLWRSNVGFGYEHAPSMPIECEGVVFGSTKGGLVFALNALDGTVLWKHKVGNSLVNTVVPLNRNELLYTTTEGYIGLLNVKEQKLNKHEKQY